MTNETSMSLSEQQIDQAVNGASDTFVHRLADALGAKASASASYGDPVERDGVTVIPVAKVRWGFGGGAGNGNTLDKLGGSGSGGAGGTLVSPIGYIEIHEGEAEFRRIKEPVPSWMLPPILLAGVLAVCSVVLVYGVLQALTPVFNVFNRWSTRS
jgi:uncharacterized spore protein YtfJ